MCFTSSSFELSPYCPLQCNVVSQTPILELQKRARWRYIRVSENGFIYRCCTLQRPRTNNISHFFSLSIPFLPPPSQPPPDAAKAHPRSSTDDIMAGVLVPTHVRTYVRRVTVRSQRPASTSKPSRSLPFPSLQSRPSPCQGVEETDQEISTAAISRS